MCRYVLYDCGPVATRFTLCQSRTLNVGCAQLSVRARRSNMSLVDRLLAAVGQDGTSVPPGRYQVPSRHFGIFSANGECNTALRNILGAFCCCFRSCRKSGLGYRLRILGVLAGGYCNVKQLRSHSLPRRARKHEKGTNSATQTTSPQRNIIVIITQVQYIFLFFTLCLLYTAKNFIDY
jgi:hypothetical protein